MPAVRAGIFLAVNGRGLTLRPCKQRGARVQIVNLYRNELSGGFCFFGVES